MNLVYQEPGSKHCVLACLATLMDLPMETVQEHARYLGIDYDEGVTNWDELRLIQYWGWQNNIVMISSATNSAHWGRTYLATVPSLNNVGGTHRIIFKPVPVEGDAVGKFLIHDPNRVGKRYGVDVLVPNWSELVEFVGDFIFPDEEASTSDFTVDKNSLDRLQALVDYKIPEIGSVWVNRKSGEMYRVYDYTNLESTRTDYPVKVSYIRLSDQTKWSRDLSDWHRSYISAGELCGSTS